MSAAFFTYLIFLGVKCVISASVMNHGIEEESGTKSTFSKSDFITFMRQNGGFNENEIKLVPVEELYDNKSLERMKRFGRRPGDDFIFNEKHWYFKTGLERIGSFHHNAPIATALFYCIYYLMHHKFYNFDWRIVPNEDYDYKSNTNFDFYRYRWRDQKFDKYYSNQQPDMGFTAHFPLPTIQGWPMDLVEACEASVTRCIYQIAYVVNQKQDFIKLFKDHFKIECDYDGEWCWKELLSNDRWRRERRFINIGYEPFDSPVSAFQFTTVASYFMCYYTLRQEYMLSSMPYDYNCHRLFIYGRHALSKYAFACAELAFCPDPCFGNGWFGYEASIIYSTPQKANNAYPARNPCWEIDGQLRKCFILRGFRINSNSNFLDLVRNKINYTCDCRPNPSESPDESRDIDFYNYNLRYSMLTRLCEDVDECQENRANCSTVEVCRNTVGSFKCTCPHGYDRQGFSNVCQRDPGLPVFIMPEIPDENEDPELGKPPEQLNKHKLVIKLEGIIDVVWNWLKNVWNKMKGKLTNRTNYMKEAGIKY